MSVSVMGPQIGDIPTVDLYRDTSGAQTEDLYRVKAGTQTEESKFIDHSIELEDGGTDCYCTPFSSHPL